MSIPCRFVGPQRIPLALLTTLTLSACSVGGPSAKDLHDKIAGQLPAFLEAGSVHLESAQSVANQGQPSWNSRFRADLRVKEDTYEEVRRDGDVVFVHKIAGSGEKKTIYGQAMSALAGKAWQSSLAFDQDGLPALGQPLHDFHASRVIVVGSEDEKRYLSEKRTKLFTTGSLRGVATGDRGAKFPVVVRFTSYDPATQRVTGQIEWTTVGGAVKKFEGQLANNSLDVRETGWVNHGDGSALFGLEYRVQLNPELTLLTGSWSGSGFSGTISLGQV